MSGFPRINYFFEILWCKAKTEGLVRYPLTRRPTNGSVAVTAQCADNAHITSSSLDVLCTSSGNWTGPIPECECDIGYQAVSVYERQICQGVGAIVMC